MEEQNFKVIAHMHSDFPSKFGIPRQSGLVNELKSTIVFEPEFRNADALKGLEVFSHIWIIWGFSALDKKEWSPTVRPPILGGNKRVGVFATRSPFRPNQIGLSSVKIEKIEKYKEHGMVVHVSGADLMNGTPIYDIKPYLNYVDCHQDATGALTDTGVKKTLKVILPLKLKNLIPENYRQSLIKVLEQDPRPSYQNDYERIYVMPYANFEVEFKVSEDNVLTICNIVLST